jgi:hypothetical protein
MVTVLGCAQPSRKKAEPSPENAARAGDTRGEIPEGGVS